MVETSHPGNIGAVARAMKNMALSQLCLVAPKQFPSADATSRAAGAHDLLSNVQIVESLAEAVADCHIIIGASARDRTISWPELTARQAAEKFSGPQYAENKIGIVFGRENSGLKNDELDLCRFLVKIPCNSAFSSLNLAAAVQVVSYEFFMAQGKPSASEAGDKETDPLATAEQMESFYQHLYQTMADIGFLHVDKSQSIMRRLRRVFNRAQLDCKELDILRGILRFSQNHNQ